MPENSSGPSNAGWITIVAAIITAIGGITAAYLLRPVPSGSGGASSSAGAGGTTGTGTGSGGYRGGSSGVTSRGGGVVVQPNGIRLIDSTNLNGSDIYNPAKETANAIACVQLCKQDGNCLAVTFVLNGGECWEKSSVPSSSYAANMVSWIK